MRLELLVNVPLAKPLPSAANLREHWAVKAERVKAQRRQFATYLLVTKHGLGLVASMSRGLELFPETRAACTLTRYAPRKLDDDNLAHAFKAIRDEVAKTLGLDDGSPRWTWTYAQEPGQPGYRIHLEIHATQETP